MRNHLFPVLTAFCVLVFLSCKPQTPAPEKPVPLKAENRQVSQKHCIGNDSEQCATFTISYPVFSGGDSTVAKALNKSVEGYLLSVLGGNGDVPFTQALDSAGIVFIQSYKSDQAENPGRPGGYTTEITNKIPLLNPKVVTIEMDGYSFMGGAHPNPFALLVSYELAKGAKPLAVTDLVSDTNAVRPILEKAYKLTKGLKETDPLNDVVYSETKQLPMPANVGVTAEGIRFYYNAYEVAPYAVGVGDVLLTWEQLGTLADKAKWIN